MAVGRVNIAGKYNVNSYITPENLGLGKYLSKISYLSICLDADGNYAVITDKGVLNKLDKDGNIISTYSIGFGNFSAAGYSFSPVNNTLELLYVGDSNAFIFVTIGNPGYVPWACIYNYNFISGTCTRLEYYTSSSSYTYYYHGARLEEDKYFFAACFDEAKSSYNIYYVNRAGIVYTKTITQIAVFPSIKVVPNNKNNFVEVFTGGAYNPSTGETTTTLKRINLSDGTIIRTLSNLTKNLLYILDDYKVYSTNSSNSSKIDILDMNNNFSVISSFDLCAGKTVYSSNPKLTNFKTITSRFTDGTLNIYNKDFSLIKNVDLSTLTALFSSIYVEGIKCIPNPTMITDGRYMFVDKLKILR